MMRLRRFLRFGCRDTCVSFLREFFNFVGIHSVDEEKQKVANDAFAEVLAGILSEPGKTTRKLKVQLGYRLSQRLQLQGSRGDVAIVAKHVGISHSFARRIVLCSLNGSEAELFERKKATTTFGESSWPQKLMDFATRADNGRSVPGENCLKTPSALY